MSIPIAKYRRLIKSLSTLETSLALQKATLDQEKMRAEARVVELLESSDRMISLYSQGTALVRRIARLRERIEQIDKRCAQLIEKIRKTKATIRKLAEYVAEGESELEKKFLEESIAAHVDRAVLAGTTGTRDG